MEARATGAEYFNEITKGKLEKLQKVSLPNRSKASITFVKNSYSIHRLLTIHGEITGDKPGRRYNIDVLNRAAIIFITGYWEAYVEDVCEEFCKFLLLNCKDYKKFPEKGRIGASRKLVKDKDERKLWSLAGEGWKKVIADHVEEFLGKFHAPEPNKVDKLFNTLLNVSSLSSSWKWTRMSSVKAKSKLEKLIDIRHAIAHGKKPPESVTKKNAEAYLSLVETLVQKTDKYLRDYGKKVIDEYAW